MNMKTYIGVISGIWLAVTGLGVLAFGIGWNKAVLQYFGALPNVSAWTEIAPLVYIVWVIITGLALIGAGGLIGVWALGATKDRSMADAQAIDLKG